MLLLLAMFILYLNKDTFLEEAGEQVRVPVAREEALDPRVRGATDVFVGGSANYSFHRILSLVQTADSALGSINDNRNPIHVD